MPQADTTSSWLLVSVVLIVVADVLVWSLLVTVALAVIGGLSLWIPAAVVALLAVAVAGAMAATTIAQRASRPREGTGP
jgi:F0F1-type ATP synthase assembly protein I